MTGEDAVAHKLKLLIDIPKWQQFKFIGDVGGTLEEQTRGLQMDTDRQRISELETKLKEIMERRDVDQVKLEQVVKANMDTYLKNPKAGQSILQVISLALSSVVGDKTELVKVLTELETLKAKASGKDG